jgi:prepilin-type N-terminal cleavage/methylation domain-containing protein
LNNRAFTLIELLIAVAIIGILAAISGANYREAIKRADIAVCQQNLRGIHTALMAYRTDRNAFPPADGTADSTAAPDRTAWGCGPAANGFWSGVSLLLSDLRYCPESTLYCPALKRTHDNSISAYPTCANTHFTGKTVPQWRFLRFAYNSAALDAGGYDGGEQNIETDSGNDIWLVRCLHLDIHEFNPDRGVSFPFQFNDSAQHPGETWVGEFELTVAGHIQPRPVKKK